MPPLTRDTRRGGPQRPANSVTSQNADLLATGLEQHRAGHLQQARETYRFILTINPREADALHLLGISYLDERPDEAEALIRQAIACAPRNPLYHFNLGGALRRQHRFDEALGAYDKALRRLPDYREAHLDRGLTLLAMHRPEEAVAAFGRALAQAPDLIAALKHRGETLLHLGRPEQAIADYDRLIALGPDDVGTLNNRGLALLRSGRFDEALKDLQKAAALAPESAEILNNCGCALRSSSRLEHALACFARAISLQPDYIDAVVNYGLTLQDLERFDEALKFYAKAQQLRPDYALAHWNEATLRLLTGDLPGGFAKAEWRRKVPELGLATTTFQKPLWLGDSSLEGKTILVHADMGFGDTIQFARYIPMLAATGARIVARVQTQLRSLIGAMGDVSLCIDKSAPLPDFDVHCPLSSLPLAFRTDLTNIPSRVPYLAAPALPTAWRDRLGENGKPAIGVAWSGNPRHANDHNRSIAFETFQTLFDGPARFISLQTEFRAQDEQVARNQERILMAGSFFADFSEAAALVSVLDLVITVDTSTAHLAGALGRPVWILLPFIPDWRWLTRRDDSVWYPTARLFRQGSDRRWEPVIRRVKQSLAEQFGP